jgi:hypothetical protein
MRKRMGQMNKSIFYIVMSLSLLLAEHGYAKERRCYTKTEVGESKIGPSKVYETTEKLLPSSASIIDFENLQITNTDNGSKSGIKKISNNVYTSLSTTPFRWFYITNDNRTIVTETSLNESVVYTKIMFCE